MAFSVASWNVEFFGSRRSGETPDEVQQRINRVFDYLLDELDADVYAIYEVNGGQVFGPVQARLPDYTWQITEGPGAQDILIGSRIPAFVTNRTEFSRGFTGPLRPGSLVTVTDNGEVYPMLFLHLKAADKAIDFGVRVHQHEKARSLRRSLDNAAAPNRSNFIVAGDLNSVGMDLTFSDADIHLQEEVDRLATMYSSHYDRMPVRTKTHDATFWNGPGSSDPPSDLDHVIAAQRINMEPIDGGAAEVAVRGWPEETTDAAKRAWIRDFSDHAALQFTVTGVAN